MTPKVILAYSGGLDTSVAIRWLQETYGMEVVTLTIDVGNELDIPAIAARARQIGAARALTVDARQEFLTYFVWPALQGNVIYEGAYPLATALARPLIAKLLVDVARSEGATAVAHGCTGKGNDQVRFDVSIMALAPDLKIIAPVREWSMTRDAEIEYAQAHQIPVAATAASPYSVDANLWGRSIECGILEDPWAEPPADVWDWTADPATAPAEATEVTMSFVSTCSATRRAKSGAATRSMGTTTAPRRTQPKKAMTHSAEFSPHNRIRSPGAIFRASSSRANWRAARAMAP